MNEVELYEEKLMNVDNVEQKLYSTKDLLKETFKLSSIGLIPFLREYKLFKFTAELCLEERPEISYKEFLKENYKSGVYALSAIAAYLSMIFAFIASLSMENNQITSKIVEYYIDANISSMITSPLVSIFALYKQSNQKHQTKICRWARENQKL